MLKLHDNIKIAVEASIMAGKAIMEVYDRDFSVDYKEDQSPLTEADTRANEIINTYLCKTNIPIISEENKQTDFAIRQKWKRCWIVDPVDGTKEFVKKNGEFTVNIALVEDGAPILGVIFVPASKILYIGDLANKVSYKKTIDNFHVNFNIFNENLIKLKPKQKNRTLEIVGSRSHMNQKTIDFIENLKETGSEIEIVSRGSSLKFCLVAEGKADIYPRFAPTMEWDTAAGQAICNAVGVMVVSQDTNKPLNYNKENLLNPEFIVS